MSTVEPARNATEEAILEAAKAAVTELGIDGLTMDAIARRAYVSRTALYFYFPNKQAALDRAVCAVFNDMEAAAAPYFEGDGDPRRELHLALRRLAAVVEREGRLLLLAAQHAGARGEHMPDEWAPHVRRLGERAQARLERDRARGLAPSDLPAGEVVRGLLAVVQQHVVHELVADRAAHLAEALQVPAELWWRAAYAHPEAVRLGMRAALRAHGAAEAARAAS